MTTSRPLRVYVAAAMRGRPEFGFPQIAAAVAEERAAGHEVFSPAERDREAGFDPTGLTGNEDLTALGFDLREALAADLEWITTTADAIRLVPGWERSTGVRAELATGTALGLLAREHVTDEWRPAAEFLARVTGPALPSSGEVRVVSETGGAKGQKLAQVSRIPARVLLELAEHFGKGVAKYPTGPDGIDNWRHGYPYSLSFDAALRHLLTALGGEDVDEETGSKHVVAAAWHCLVLADRMNRPEMARFDDRQDPRA